MDSSTSAEWEVEFPATNRNSPTLTGWRVFFVYESTGYYQTDGSSIFPPDPPFENLAATRFVGKIHDYTLKNRRWFRGNLVMTRF
jgi:hypothetical protein